MDRLTIWRADLPVAYVERERGRLRLRYTHEATAAFAPGTPLISLKLPLSDVSYPNGVTHAFLDGLLPEGNARRQIAEDLRLVADDTFGLIRALGRDCAGALMILPDGDTPSVQPTVHFSEELSDDQLDDLVRNLHAKPLGVDDRVRIALAGVQEKLSLTRRLDGRWGRPVDGAPSTHILKPPIAGYATSVENEVFCMTLLARLGIPVPAVTQETIAERPVIVVERFDRTVDVDGRVTRLHQEDACQAFGIPPAKKYQEDGGPSLVQIGGILAATDRDGLLTLFAATALNVIVGNGDAHGKNISFVLDGDGGARLSPIYDVLSTLLYADRRLAMYIDTVQRTERVTRDRLISEAARWGLSRSRTEPVLDDILQRLPEAVTATTAVASPPVGLIEIIERQAAQLAPS